MPIGVPVAMATDRDVGSMLRGRNLFIWVVDHQSPAVTPFVDGESRLNHQPLISSACHSHRPILLDRSAVLRCVVSFGA
jgi:hypothetical protein